MAHIDETILRDLSMAVKGGRLCNFYKTWKLHLAADTAGLRSRPIGAPIDEMTSRTTTLWDRS